MKKSLNLVLAFALVLVTLAGCSGKPAEDKAPPLSPEEQSALYAEAIKTAQGDGEGAPIMTQKDDIPELMFSFLGFDSKDAEALALSVSLVNIKAYGIVFVKPAEGKEETVKIGLQTFIDNQRQSFENYLVDQYTIAQNARLETLEDGTLIMVMAPDGDAVYESISASLAGK